MPPSPPPPSLPPPRLPFLQRLKAFLFLPFTCLFALFWTLLTSPFTRRHRTSPPYKPPPLWLLRLVSFPFSLFNPPEARHMEHLLGCVERGDKIILIGDQCLLGLDQLVLVTLLYAQCGVFVRRLHDALFGKVPVVRSFLGWTGGVKGTKKTCEEMMGKGEPLLFFPGGIAESFKTRKVPKYSLLWGDRLGFIMLCIKHGYTLVPFSSVGMEDAVKVLFHLPMQPFLRLYGETRPPISFPVLCPFYNSLERQYFTFGKPIPTRHYEGAFENVNYCREVFDKLHAHTYMLVEEGKKRQRNDEGRYLSGRVRVWVRECLLWVLGQNTHTHTHTHKDEDGVGGGGGRRLSGSGRGGDGWRSSNNSSKSNSRKKKEEGEEQKEEEEKATAKQLRQRHGQGVHVAGTVTGGGRD